MPRKLQLTKSRGAALCGLFASAILLVDLLLPLSWDNWVYQTMGWDLYTFGKLPYLGSWDVNFPGIVYLHAIAIALLGKSNLSFRVFDFVFEIGTSLLIYKLLVRWFRPSYALLSSLLYPLLYVSLGWRAAGQRDAFAVFFLLAGMELFLGSTERPMRFEWHALCAGFLIAACAIIRPTYGLWPISIGLAYVLSGRRADSRFWNFLGGCGLAVVALVLPFAMVSNGLRDFYRFTILFNIDVYSQHTAPLSDFFISLQTTGYVFASYVTLGAVTVLFVRLKWIDVEPGRIPRFERLAYILLIISSLISIFVMRTYQADHFLPLLVLLSPLAAYPIYELCHFNPKWIGVPFAICLTLYFMVRLYPRNLIHHVINARSSGKQPIEYVYQRVDDDPRTGRLAEEQAVSYLRKEDSTYQPIEVVCYNRPYLRVEAGLPSATRFTEILPLVMEPKRGHFTEYQQEWRKEYVEQLQKVEPVFIVFADNQSHPYVSVGPFQAAESIHGFSSILQQEYMHDTTIYGFDFYRRKN